MTNLLAQPMTLPCGVSIPNRLLKSAMTEGMADASGHATEQLNNLYEAWSKGGTGVLITGNVQVDHRYLERPGNVIAEDESGLDALRAFAKAATVNGNHCWVQISHPGRQCQRVVSKQPLAPSAVKLKLPSLFFSRPREMTVEDIEDAIQRYANTARIVKKAGFTGVQVHGAHGYLCSQFLSPLSNQRTDEWGGSLENRARFLLTVVACVRDAVGADFPVAVKLNSADFQKGGFDHEESIQVAKWLEEAGVDLLEISGGTYEQLALMGRAEEQLSEASQKREAYFLHYSTDIRKAISIPFCVTGGFRQRETMLKVLDDGEMDMVGLARPLCTEPDISQKLLDGTAETTHAFEGGHALGKGYLGPRSRNSTMRMINSQASVAWYYRQLLLIANKQPVNLKLGVRKALRLHFFLENRLVKARNRVLKNRTPKLEHKG